MTPVSPVILGLEDHEILIAKDQPEYIPLPALRLNGPEKPVMSRWRLTPEEKLKIEQGGDIVLTLLTFGSPLQPICLEVVSSDDTPEFALQNAGAIV